MKTQLVNRLAGFVILCLSFTVSLAQSQPKALGLCLENYEYPFPVQYLSLTVQAQPVKMAFMDLKPANANGKTVLLLHGKNFNGAYWRQTAQALADKGFRVIMPDQVGFGKSSKPTAIQYTFQLLARNTKALLDSLQINKVAVLGHSMGGMRSYPLYTHVSRDSRKIHIGKPHRA